LKWIPRKQVSADLSECTIVERLAKVRGIKNLNEWLNPSSKHVHNKYLLLNIDKAVQEIIKAVHKEWKIQIVADVDTDGVCSTAIIYNYLKEFTYNISYVYAQRSKGHGVEKVLDKIDDDTKLVIIVDSSSNSVEACKTLYEKGVRVIIIDHHQIDRENPYALIVNCQMGNYPNKHLSGSAMVYKVCQVLDDYFDIELADNFLDLTAIGLVGDMMNVKNMENRYLIYNGINNINNLGVQEILKQSNINYTEGITTTDISFKIAPIISACSRFDRIELALKALTSDDVFEVAQTVREMITMNEQRKKEQKQIIEKATESVDDSNNVIVITDNNIDSGFRGLVATQFVEMYSKPVFVLGLYDGVYKGSARSIGTVPLKSLCQQSGLFNLVQGHEGAFGVEFPEENLNDLIEYFNNTLSKEDLQRVVEYDLELNVNEIEELDILEIEKFSKIVGQGFPQPVFKISGIVVEEGYSNNLGTYVRAVMGANNDTIKINCENNFALMKFRTNEDYGKDIEEHFYDDSNFMTELDVVGTLNLNKFYNRGIGEWEITKQIYVIDYKIVD
jgi:single-stranded-DNA-specific exonuclease